MARSRLGVVVLLAAGVALLVWQRRASWLDGPKDFVCARLEDEGSVVVRATLLEEPRLLLPSDVGTPLVVSEPDGSWLVRLRIEAAVVGVSPLAPGSVQQALVHSPTFFFWGAAAPGRQYRFRLTVTSQSDGTARITGLEVTC